MKLNNVLVFSVITTALLAGCGERDRPTTNQQVQRKEAAQAQTALITYNQDLNNAKRRRDILNKPATPGYLLLYSASGQPIWYGVIDGKPSTLGKTVQPTQEYRCVQAVSSGGCADAIVDAPDEYGLYSRGSRPGIYFFTPSGAMIEHTDGYTFSTQPLRIDAKPIAILIETK